MASWQAHVVTFLARQVIRKPLLRSPDVKTLRKVLGGVRVPKPRGYEATSATLNGIRGEWVTATVQTRGTLLYLHGGAFVTCSPGTHRPLTSWFAKRGWRVFAPDYRLAPEHLFPAQIEDVVAVYRSLLESGVDAKSLTVAGDSAGGNLVLALCLSLRNAGLPQPAAIAMLSPVTDFTASGASIETNSERCAMFSKQLVPTARDLYLGGHDPRDPLVSPYFADLKGLPPMIFHASSDEVLRDDSIRTAENARKAGIDAQVRTWPVVPHVWQILHPFIPEGRESLKLIDEFLSAKIRR